MSPRATNGPPRRSTATLRVAAVPAAARETRRWAMSLAREQGAAGSATRVVELLVSEVVTNAVKYGSVTGSLAVAVQVDDGAMTVRVTDENPVRPVVRRALPEDTGGRGMELVETLAQDWGVDEHGTTGKTVWFRVGLR